MSNIYFRREYIKIETSDFNNHLSIFTLK